MAKYTIYSLALSIFVIMLGGVCGYIAISPSISRTFGGIGAMCGVVLAMITFLPLSARMSIKRRAACAAGLTITMPAAAYSLRSIESFGVQALVLTAFATVVCVACAVMPCARPK